METARKLDESENYSSSIEELREAYPEFARLLRQREDEVLGRERVARLQLDEQITTDPGDVADVSVIDTSADYFLKLANNQQKELNEIRSALDRIRRGVYGICESCEEPIAIERLRRLPYARFCINCQTTIERQRRVGHLAPTPKL